MAVTPITAPDVPTPRGHYSHAVIANGFVFVSGHLGVREDGSHNADQPFAAQARQALANLMRILAAAGCGAEDVARVTVYIAGMEHWAAFNAIYADIFGPHRPARAVVPVGPLNHGYLVEIDAVAALPG
jgi:reactive intermediate/imine deaminase